jgi:uncharacterized protein YcbK (DUF882 family)
MHAVLRAAWEDGGMMDRRDLLKLGLGVFAALGSAPALARTSYAPRSLALDNVHTGERLRATYWERGEYLPDALDEINRILRDYRTDEAIDMDIRLLDLLHVLRATVGSRRPFEILSGYRSPATNAALLEEGYGVAEHSFHIVGKAIDIRLSDRSTSALRRAATRLQRGGVGYYPSSGFVHVDVGPVRHW